MIGEPVPTEPVEQAITNALGMHGAWVLAIETYDPETGEPRLAVMWDAQSTAWTRLGMAHALVGDLETPFRQSEEEA